MSLWFYENIMIDDDDQSVTLVPRRNERLGVTIGDVDSAEKVIKHLQNFIRRKKCKHEPKDWAEFASGGIGVEK